MTNSFFASAMNAESNLRAFMGLTTELSHPGSYGGRFTSASNRRPASRTRAGFLVMTPKLRQRSMSLYVGLKASRYNSRRSMNDQLAVVPGEVVIGPSHGNPAARSRSSSLLRLSSPRFV